jgi:hypothetical protein
VLLLSSGSVKKTVPVEISAGVTREVRIAMNDPMPPDPTDRY